MGGPGDLASEAQNELQKALFGALLTLHKERWEDSKRFLAGRVLLEHLQLVLVLLQAQFLWTFDTSYWAWRILNFSLLKNLTVPGVSSVGCHVGGRLVAAQRGCLHGQLTAPWSLSSSSCTLLLRQTGPHHVRGRPVRFCGRCWRDARSVRMGVVHICQERRCAKQVVSRMVLGSHVGVVAGGQWAAHTVATRPCGGRASSRRPVKLLRLVMVVYYKILYVMVLNYLLGPLNCS